MVPNPYTESVTEEAGQQMAGDFSDRSSDPASDLLALRNAARKFASGLGWLPGVRSSKTFAGRCRKLKTVFGPLFAGVDAAAQLNPASDDLRWFRDNDQLIYSELRSVGADLKPF